DLRDEPPRRGLGGRDASPGEQEIESPPDAADAWTDLRPARGGDHSQGDLGEREHGRLRGDPQITMERGLEARSDRIALHGCDGRPRQMRHQAPEVAGAPDAPSGRRRWRGTELGEIRPGAKVPTRAAHD